MNAEVPLALRRSVRARADLLDIWVYVSEHDRSAADRAVENIERICRLLTEHPRMGRERSEIQSGLRSFAMTPWLVFYRIAPDAIEVIRIVHGARDLTEVDY